MTKDGEKIINMMYWLTVNKNITFSYSVNRIHITSKITEYFQKKILIVSLMKSSIKVQY